MTTIPQPVSPTTGYTPYGQAEVLTASFTADPDGKSDSDNDITFTGQRFDAESRLILYRHRYYHPVIGTFCSRDPIGYRGSRWNLDEYVASQPLDRLDLTGQLVAIVIRIVGVGIAGLVCYGWLQDFIRDCGYTTSNAKRYGDKPTCPCDKSAVFQESVQSITFCSSFSWSGPCGGQWVCP